MTEIGPTKTQWYFDWHHDFSVDAPSGSRAADAQGRCPLIWLRCDRRAASHTPGQWVFEESQDRVIAPGQIVKGEVAIVGVLSGHFETERRYNGALIAKAPELLEALQDMLAQHGCKCGHPYCKTCDRIKDYEKLIEEAKGKEE